MASSSTNVLTHFMHPPSNLTHLRPNTDYLCDGCKIPATATLVTCSLCRFILHDCCAMCPTRLTSTYYHQHPMSLAVHQPQPNHTQRCNICRYPIMGLAYQCKGCNFWLHPLCVSHDSGKSQNHAIPYGVRYDTGKSQNRAIPDGVRYDSGKSRNPGAIPFGADAERVHSGKSRNPGAILFAIGEAAQRVGEAVAGGVLTTLISDGIKEYRDDKVPSAGSNTSGGNKAPSAGSNTSGGHKVPSLDSNTTGIDDEDVPSADSYTSGSDGEDKTRSDEDPSAGRFKYDWKY